MISNRGHHPIGQYVPAELEDRVGHEEIQLQLTILLKSKANSQYFSSGGPVVCDFTMETLLDKAKPTQTCSQVPSIKFKSTHIEFQ